MQVHSIYLHRGVKPTIMFNVRRLIEYFSMCFFLSSMRHSIRLSLISDYLHRMCASNVPLADCRYWSKTITNCVTWNKFKKFSCEVCGPYVTGSLWLSMYIWVLNGQGLKSRMDTKTDICLNEIGQCSQNTKIVLSSWVTTLRGPMWTLKENHYNLQIWPLRPWNASLFRCWILQQQSLWFAIANQMR
jgi:hypothetical protein